VYNNSLANIDAYPAGLLEARPDSLGELFTSVILEQFLRIRDADRFWFENVDNGRVAIIRIMIIIHIASYVIHAASANQNQNASPCKQLYIGG